MILKKINLFLTFLFAGYFSFGQYTGKIIQVIDGDSFIVEMIDGTKEKVTFYGIDAPELDQEYGKAAKNYLKKYLYTMVDLEYKNRNTDAEMMAIVYYLDQEESKVNLNYEVVENGLAWKNKYTDDNQLDRIEKKARRKKIGLWKNPRAIEPWEWKEKEG
ncbi:MAG: thermonuclease family protein [Bacteroidota bacterium]